MDEHHQHQDQDLDHSNNNINANLDHDHETVDLDQDDDDNINGRNILNNEPDPFYCMDNPPESYAVCQTKVADWLDLNNTFIERMPSVKLASSKTLDPCQKTSSRRSVSITQKPKLSIIEFRKKPVRQMDRKNKHNDRVDNVRLFRNRSELGRDYCLLITEPVSPRVSCAGRAGSVRVVQGLKGSVWRSFKAAFSNLVQTKIVA